MSKQVPENEREQQFAELRNFLLGNPLFRRHRGNMGSLIHYVAWMAKHAENPTDFCQKWDELCADARVFGNMLAKFARDGKDEAFNALTQSLYDKDYVFPGEEIPYEKTIPVTVIMLEPERTMLMLRFLLDFPYIIPTYFGLNPDSKGPLSPEDTERVERLLEAFPSLEPAFKANKEHWEGGWELGYAYCADVLRNYGITSRYQRREFKGLSLSLPQLTQDMWYYLKSGETIKLNGVEASCTGCFLFLFRGDQKEALSMFTREQQEHIATWQFHVPSDSIRGLGLGDDKFDLQHARPRIGLHEESEHEQWKFNRPGYASNGVAIGLGGLFNPPDEGYRAFEMSWKLEKSIPFRVIFDIG